MLVLFDIDGTLTTGSSCGRRSFESALAAHFDVPGLLSGVALHGNIDVAIVREAASRLGRWPDDPNARRALTARVLEIYRETFLRELSAQPYRALPGAHDAVHAARGAGATVGLATGNIEPCARAKLRSAGLGEVFEGCVGGFGDDGEVRVDVVRAAIERARARGGGHDRVLVIGDTPADVRAALDAGAEIACVSTGPCDAETLRAAGATLVFDGLVALAAAAPWA